jgi:hypothetical protein
MAIILTVSLCIKPGEHFNFNAPTSRLVRIMLSAFAVWAVTEKCAGSMLKYRPNWREQRTFGLVLMCISIDYFESKIVLKACSH